MPENLRVQINPSQMLFAYLLALYGGAVAVLSLLPLPSALFVTLCGLLLLHLGWLVWRDVRLLHRTSVTGLSLVGGRCVLIYGRYPEKVTQFKRGRLGVQHFVTNKLVILQVLPEGERYAVWLPLFADAVAPETFRRLRVRLYFPVIAGRRS